jgi:hypothetical protein
MQYGTPFDQYAPNMPSGPNVSGTAVAPGSVSPFQGQVLHMAFTPVGCATLQVGFGRIVALYHAQQCPDD